MIPNTKLIYFEKYVRIFCTEQVDRVGDRKQMLEFLYCRRFEEVLVVLVEVFGDPPATPPQEPGGGPGCGPPLLPKLAHSRQ